MHVIILKLMITVINFITVIKVITVIKCAADSPVVPTSPGNICS